ncbi:amidohydrolase family protein [Leifsonia sp. NPDC058248]|uniref:amidohydrolase family protein n=1 Tax=Leifsonia sp. NPDC058248 TaxID=3346402 RepID=UPI0036DA969A
MTIGFDAAWDGERFRGHTVFAIEQGMLRPVDEERADRELGGALIPHLTDHHTHLGLTDPAELFANGITDAVDLGWIPEVASGWLIDAPGHPAVQIAGALLTAPGGYPINAGWAPPGSSAEVGSADEGEEAVRGQLIRGASRIKVTLNTDAGPTVDNLTLSAIVEAAHSAGVPVTVHVQGTGQTARAIDAGIDQLAHTPFSERVDDGTILRAVAAGMTWVSTLDIHGWGRPSPEFAVAVDNLRRFARAGGRVLYGTDLGNGPLANGVNARELTGIAAAGLGGDALVRTIAGDAPLGDVGPRFAWIPTPPPAPEDDPTGDPAASGLPAWLATARGLTTTIPGGLA